MKLKVLIVFCFHIKSKHVTNIFAKKFMTMLFSKCNFDKMTSTLVFIMKNFKFTEIYKEEYNDPRHIPIAYI